MTTGDDDILMDKWGFPVSPLSRYQRLRADLLSILREKFKVYHNNGDDRLVLLQDAILVLEDLPSEL